MNEKLMEENHHPKSRYKDRSVQIGLNGDKLSVSDAALITLARALLSSCDLLLISNLLDGLSADALERVMQVLDQWVIDRCVLQLKTECLAMGGLHGKEFRKKKTVLLTSKRHEEIRRYTNNKVINFNQVVTEAATSTPHAVSGPLVEHLGSEEKREFRNPLVAEKYPEL